MRTKIVARKLSQAAELIVQQTFGKRSLGFGEEGSTGLIAIQFSLRSYLPRFREVLPRGLLLDVAHQPGVFGSSAWQELELKKLLHLLFEPSN